MIARLPACAPTFEAHERHFTEEAAAREAHWEALCAAIVAANAAEHADYCLRVDEEAAAAMREEAEEAARDAEIVSRRAEIAARGPEMLETVCHAYQAGGSKSRL